MRPKDSLRQAAMFPLGADLPLFSGTPQTVHASAFAPIESEGRQESLASCSVCLDTGWVEDKRCWCHDQD